MKTHETLECSWRKVNYEYCQELVIMNEKQVCNRFIKSIFTTLNLLPSYPLYEPARSSAILILNHLPCYTLSQIFPIIIIRLYLAPLVFNSPSRMWASITKL